MSRCLCTSYYQSASKNGARRHSELDAESRGFKLRYVSVFDAAGCRVKPGMTKTKMLSVYSI